MSFETLIGLLVAYGYWIVFAAILLDNAGLPIPGELVLITLGGMARHGLLDPVVGLMVAILAAVVGDSLAYYAGRLGGDFIARRLPAGRRRAPRRRAVVLGKFVVGARMFLAPLAGLGGMPYRRFLVFDSLGVSIWASAFIGLGYVFGDQFHAVQQTLRTLGIISLIALTAVIAGYIIARRFRPASQPVPVPIRIDE